MKLKLKKETLKILSDAEAALVAGGVATGQTGCTGTACGPTGLAACGTTGTETFADCTNSLCYSDDCTGGTN